MTDPQLLQATNRHAEAETLYRRAQAIAEANGEGVPKDDVAAYMWFNLAAASGNKGAATQMQVMEKIMTPEKISEAQKLSREWKQKK